ncbi:HI1506-related protein [uncultured Amphritea sp.]|uniref:HI1506-related protein n=1 Tax=uncultured Amphritea sp. TaxID=981605 RepID=UPI00263340B3|nr:HI1506-related protein [uncultured Amphritea sp.]
MSKATIIVICAAGTGYRRAGEVFQQGRNEFPADHFNEAQLEQLRSDRRTELLEGEAVKDSEAQGAVDAKRLAELVAHIGQLDKEDAALWKEDGSPKANAYPKGTTAEERDAAWEAFTDELDKA